MSDTHGRHRDLELPTGDILIHAGDITHFGKEHQLNDFNSWLGELQYTAKIVVAGNHECNNDINLKEKLSNAIYLDSSSCEVLNLKIFGIKFYPFEYSAHIPIGTDIVISHNPPYCIGDAGGKSREGTGCLGLLNNIENVKPKLHVFGHVHTGYGIYDNIEKYPETIFVNAANCGGKYGYALTNQPIVVDL